MSDYCCFVGICTIGLFVGAYALVPQVSQGTQEYASIGDASEWHSAKCTPFLEERGRKCCDEHCGGFRAERFYNVTEADECDDNFIAEEHEADMVCITANDYVFGSWPEEFYQPSTTLECWTDCDAFMMSDPAGEVFTASLKLIFGYILFFMFGCCPCFCTAEYEEGQTVEAAVGLLWLIIMNAIFLWQVSIYNCVGHFSGTGCSKMIVSYVLACVGPALFVPCMCASNILDQSSVHRVQLFVQMFSALLHPILSGFFLMTAMTEGGIGECFDISWCEQQSKASFGAYIFLFIMMILYMGFFRQGMLEYCKRMIDTKEMLKYEWRVYNDRVIQAIQGDWRSSDGVKIAIQDRTVKFLSLGEKCRLEESSELKIDMNNKKWTLRNKTFMAENVKKLIWKSEGPQPISIWHRIEESLWGDYQQNACSKIQGDWTNSEGLLINVTDRNITFQPSGNCYFLFGDSMDCLDIVYMQIGGVKWTLNTIEEHTLVWKATGEAPMTWQKRSAMVPNQHPHPEWGAPPTYHGNTPSPPTSSVIGIGDSFDEPEVITTPTDNRFFAPITAFVQKQWGRIDPSSRSPTISPPPSYELATTTKEHQI